MSYDPETYGGISRVMREAHDPLPDASWNPGVILTAKHSGELPVLTLTITTYDSANKRLGGSVLKVADAAAFDMQLFVQTIFNTQKYVATAIITDNRTARLVCRDVGKGKIQIVNTDAVNPYSPEEIDKARELADELQDKEERRRTPRARQTRRELKRAMQKGVSNSFELT